MIKRLVFVGMCGVVSGVTNAAAQTAASQATAVADSAQSGAPAAQAEDRARTQARRFGVGVQGGVGIDPELIDVGAHATFGPLFKPALTFRPAIEVGAGEVTTFLGVNLDFLYELRSNANDEGWVPYAGAGPTFGLSHRGFDIVDDEVDDDDVPNRFDFSDTDFNGGMNFIVGMRKSRMFFEMKATAWGVSNIRLVAGYNF